MSEVARERTEHELRVIAADVLNTSRRMNRCPERHGYCCEYHQGFDDALDIMIERLTHAS